MKKNVLVILTDQQRKDSLGCYGNTVANTPNLDRLAGEGIRFERNYVANPICMPDRLSIFTGMFPRNHGLWTNGLLLEKERRTLAHQMADKGYQTASFGKIHFEPFGPDTGGSREGRNFWRKKGDDFDWNGPYWGFEHVELTIGHTEPIAHYGRWFRKNGGREHMLKQAEDGSRPLPPELHDSSFVADRTIDFIGGERDENRPFFAVASFPDPHAPFNPPQSLAKKYNLDQVELPVGGPEDLESRPGHYYQHYQGGWHRSGIKPLSHPEGINREEEKQRIANTYAMVELIDQNVGRIINALEENDLMEETIIIFTSDHGELLGDHGLWAKGPFFYECLINTPLIITARGQLEPAVSGGLFSAIDIFPTICDLTGIEIPHYVNGISQKDHLLNPDHKIRDRCLVEYRNGYGDQDVSSMVMVTEDKKYVKYETGERELTDLSNDPKEKKNVAEDVEYKDTVNKMNEEMLEEILSTESDFPEQVSHA